MTARKTAAAGAASAAEGNSATESSAKDRKDPSREATSGPPLSKASPARTTARNAPHRDSAATARKGFCWLTLRVWDWALLPDMFSAIQRKAFISGR